MRTKLWNSFCLAVLIAIIWIISSSLGLMVAFIRNPAPVDKENPCFMQKLVHSAVLRLIFWFIIPFSLLTVIVLYVRIYHRVSTMVQFKSTHGRSICKALLTILRSNLDQAEMGRVKVRKIKEIRTTILMLITVTLFVICWLPSVISLVFLVLARHLVQPYMRTAVFVLYSLNSTINPFLYAFHISRLKKRLKEIWNFFLCVREGEEVNSLRSNVFPSQSVQRQSSRACFNEFDLALT